MSELETAQQHLELALQRFEDALARRLAATGGDEGTAQLDSEREKLARDVGTLQAECDRLGSALSEAEREQKSLRAVNEDVAQRLDGSIDELNRLLEG